MSPDYESIEPQFDLAAQEAKAAGRRPEGERPPYEGEDSAEQAAVRAELAEKARELESLADEIEKEALEAEQAQGEVVEVPELPKVDQEPELKPEVGGQIGSQQPPQIGSWPQAQFGGVQGG